MFAEWIKEVGERNPTDYVTGGPSNRAQIWEVGGAYKWRFATLRASVSHGNYGNPGGSQIIYLMGVDLAVTKNVDFIVEWVRWDAKAQHGPERAEFDDSINFVINWRF